MQFNLNVTPVTMLNFGGTAQKEIEIFIYVLDFVQIVHLSCFKSLSRKVSTDFHAHDGAVCFKMLC